MAAGSTWTQVFRIVRYTLGVKSTQLHGMLAQIESWLDIIPDMPGYEATDTNPLGELEGYLNCCIDEIAYALRELDD